MKNSVLLFSRNESLLTTRAELFSRAGYQAYCASDHRTALLLARSLRPRIVIVGHSLNEIEQMAFVDELHESQPDLSVLLLRSPLMRLERLFAECETFLGRQPGSVSVRSLTDLSESIVTKSPDEIEGESIVTD